MLTCGGGGDLQGVTEFHSPILSKALMMISILSPNGIHFFVRISITEMCLARTVALTQVCRFAMHR